jgi:hypothetical protein
MRGGHGDDYIADKPNGVGAALAAKGDGIAGKPAPTGKPSGVGAALAAKGAEIAGKPAPTSKPNDVGAALAAKAVGIAGKPAPTSKPVPTGKPAPIKAIPGLGPCIEFRSADLPDLRRRLKRHGIAHVLVAQDGHYKTGFKRRVLRLLWYPPDATSFSPLLNTVPSRRGTP